MARPLTSDRSRSSLPELETLERILADAPPGWLEVRRDAAAPASGLPALPVYTICIGSSALDRPALGLFGGVHGLERIGAQVVLAFLQGLVSRLAWDATLHAQLERLRLVFMPIVNPGGMLRGTRANPRGVDLMRNAPLDATDPVPFLVGGQRISAGLPWFRGRMGEPMEPESDALCRTVERELMARPFSVALDCHSGFGTRDRLWFPYAGRRAPFAQAAAVHALHDIFVGSNTHHPYVFEPQSRHYLAHGDLWDHLSIGAPAERVFLPFTLEMGSWLWVKKNPRQLFSLAGIFNPLIAHREQRVLRRHLPLLDFMMRATVSWERWLPRGESARRHRELALARWYLPPRG